MKRRATKRIAQKVMLKMYYDSVKRISKMTMALSASLMQHVINTNRTVRRKDRINNSS